MWTAPVAAATGQSMHADRFRSSDVTSTSSTETTTASVASNRAALWSARKRSMGGIAKRKNAALSLVAVEKRDSETVPSCAVGRFGSARHRCVRGRARRRAFLSVTGPDYARSSELDWPESASPRRKPGPRSGLLAGPQRARRRRGAAMALTSREGPGFVARRCPCVCRRVSVSMRLPPRVCSALGSWPSEAQFILANFPKSVPFLAHCTRPRTRRAS